MGLALRHKYAWAGLQQQPRRRTGRWATALTRKAPTRHPAVASVGGQQRARPHIARTMHDACVCRTLMQCAS